MPSRASDSKVTLASSLYETVRRGIVSGEFRPEEKMRLATLMGRYSVGASPLREALSRLAGEGLVTQYDQRGFIVPGISVPELRELTKTRCFLHEIMIRESLLHGDSDWEDTLVLSWHHLNAMKHDGKPEVLNPAWERLHREFHMSLVAGCGSDSLIAFYGQLYDYVDRYRYVWADSNPLVRDVNCEHRAIMEAAVARDVPHTIELLDSHIRVTAQFIERYAGTLADSPSRDPQDA